MHPENKAEYVKAMATIDAARPANPASRLFEIIELAPVGTVARRIQEHPMLAIGLLESMKSLITQFHPSHPLRLASQAEIDTVEGVATIPLHLRQEAEAFGLLGDPDSLEVGEVEL